MSIKNKFATAVATASLLAGLFGSAFVPSAMGVVILPVDSAVAKYATLTEGTEVKQAGSAKVFGFQTDDSDDLAVDANAYIDIALFTAGAAGAGTTKLDLTDAVNAAAVLKATSSNSAVNVGWGYDNDTTDVLPADSDGAGADTAGDGSVDAVACNGDITVGTTSSVVDVTGSDNAGALADTNVTGYPTAHNGIFRLCFASETVTTAATSTITITWDGAVVATFTVTAVGPVASLTASITDGYKYVAEDNDAIEEWFTIVAKDAAGVQINGASTSISAESVSLNDWTDQPENKQESQIVALGVDIDNIGTGTAFVGYELEADVCLSESGDGEGDGDAASSYALKFEDASGDVVSNAVTITCTLNSDGARVTAVTPEATTNAGSPNGFGGITYNETAAGSDDILDLVATVVDENGTPLGDGADDVDFDWDFEGDADLNWDDYGLVPAAGGEIVLGDIEPDTTRFGRFTYTVTALDSDLAITAAGDDAVEKAFAKTFTAVNSASAASISKVRNAAKTTAIFTADMGEDAAFDVVSFTVELKNGTVVVYDRRANANGVAKLTLSKRTTTIYVYASYNSDTNVMKCVFR
jgi:hypothetical protein